MNVGEILSKAPFFLPSWRFCSDKTTLFVDQTLLPWDFLRPQVLCAGASDLQLLAESKGEAVRAGMEWGPPFSDTNCTSGDGWVGGWMDGWMDGWIDTVYFWTALDRMTGHCQVCKACKA